MKRSNSSKTSCVVFIMNIDSTDRVLKGALPLIEAVAAGLVSTGAPSIDSVIRGLIKTKAGRALNAGEVQS
jgi:hypothetical protein